MPSPKLPPPSPSKRSLTNIPLKSKFRSKASDRRKVFSTPTLALTSLAEGDFHTMAQPRPAYGLQFQMRFGLYPQNRLEKLNNTSAWILPILNFCFSSQWGAPPPCTGTPVPWAESSYLSPECLVAPRCCSPLYIRRTPIPGVNHFPVAMSNAGAMRSPKLACLSWSPK